MSNRKTYMRFEPTNSRYALLIDRVTPVQVILEADERGIDRPVRVSEHRWPVHDTFSCWEDVEWPAPPAAVTRSALMHSLFLLDWREYPLGGTQNYLALTTRDIMQAQREVDGLEHHPLPEDYLEFWLEQDIDVRDVAEAA